MTKSEIKLQVYIYTFQNKQMELFITDIILFHKYL